MSDKAVILLVHSDPRARLLAGLELSREFALESASPSDARSACERTRPALVILHVPANGLDEPGLISDLRELRTPVLVMGERDDPAVRARSVALGADDVVEEPFEPDDLLRRVRFLLRIEAPYSEATLVRTDGVEVDLIRQTVRVRGSVVELSEPEWMLLEHLAANKGMVCLYREILAKVWRNQRDLEDLRACAESLRVKLGDDPAQPFLLLDFHGVGYCMANVDPLSATGSPTATLP